MLHFLPNYFFTIKKTTPKNASGEIVAKKNTKSRHIPTPHVDFARHCDVLNVTLASHCTNTASTSETQLKKQISLTLNHNFLDLAATYCYN